MKTFIKLLGTLALVAMSASANANVIDLFTEPAGGQGVIDNTNGADADNAINFSEAGNFPNTIVGGYRDLKADAISGAVDANGDGLCDVVDACTTLNVFNGLLSFSNDAPSVTGIGIVQWDGQDNSSNLDTAGLGDLDFVNQAGCPSGGCDRFIFEVVTADLGFNFSVGVYTSATEYSVFDLASSGGPGTRELLFSFFENDGLCGAINPAPGVNSVACGVGGAADMTMVNALELILNTGGPLTAAVDLSIRGITKVGVPEPGILALMGIGGLMAGAFGRSRRRSKSKA